MRHRLRCLLAAALLAGQGSLVAFAADAPTGSAVQSQTLLSTDADWLGHAYPDYPAGQPRLSMLRITIPAHTALPWHTHPMPNAAYVVSGNLTVETRDGRRRTLQAGDTLAEMVGVAHRGVTTEQPVELLVFYAGINGQPLSQRVLP